VRASWFVSAVAAAVSALVCSDAFASDASVAWLRDGAVESRTLSTAARPDPGATAPLGSLWKLFVFSYLSEIHANEPPYVCEKPRRAAASEDQYCCEPGASVGRDAALARSCAPYFEPARLALDPAEWKRHWEARSAAPWLLDLRLLEPGTQVRVDQLLAALAAISPDARADARRALLDANLTGYGRDAWTALGTGVRYKTYTWHLAKSPGVSYGGAAGWLPDGTPFWFGARGSSRTALAAWAPQLAHALPRPHWRDANPRGMACVDVDFFERYALKAVWLDNEARRAPFGTLEGRYRLEFANGNWLRISAAGDLELRGSEAAPRITGRFAANEYVARVIDREGNAANTHAARALAIAARTYLVQNARLEGGCWRIEDSTRAQRVSPNPPSEGALAAAWFTDEIVLHGAPVRYHHHAPGVNRLAWRDAVARADAGWDFDRILAEAYPKTTLATLNGSEDCTRMDAAETWLVESEVKWRRELRREPGFEPVAGPVRVCALAYGAPYSDQQRGRIYARGWRTLDERVTLAHEYLHIAFRFHPNGVDEAYIERLARRLIGGS
jgi:uncharacterized protein YfaQ (DUF2300 family)